MKQQGIHKEINSAYREVDSCFKEIPQDSANTARTHWLGIQETRGG